MQSKLTATLPMPILLWTIPGMLIGATYLDLAIRSAAPGGATLVDLIRTVVIATLGIAFVAIRGRRSGSAPPLTGILGFSLLFHLIGVAGTPVLEDDGFRYLFDAWVFVEHGSPYAVAPDAFFDSIEVPSAIESILSGINNPHLSTIYGPTAQWVFRLAYLISPAEIRVLQAIMGALSFVLVCLVSKHARPLPLLFFAWHPLLIKEFAFTAHPDVLAVLLLAAACAIARRHRIALGAVLALAVGAKIFALLFVPVLLRRSHASWAAFAITLVALYAPFADSLIPASGLSRDSLWTMGAGWIFNAPIYIALQPFVGPLVLRAMLAGIFLTYWVAWTRTNLHLAPGEWPRGDQLFGLMLLCSPVLNPWYVLWPLVFWIRHPTKWLMVASITSMLSYAHGLHLVGHSLAPYEISSGVLVLEYASIAVALALDLSARKTSHHH